MDPKTFGAIRRVLKIVRKANKDADAFDKQGFEQSAEIADAYAAGAYAALRAALYGA